MALFNFIYKNDAVIQSLSAQIFSGLLQSMETQECGRHKESGQMEGGIPPVVKGNIASEDSNEKTQRTVMLPHDSALHDVLVTLAPRMKNTVAGSCFGDILRLKGNLYIIPSEIETNGIETLFQAFSPQLDMKGIPAKAQPAVRAFIKKALISTQPGSRFFFASEREEFLRGFLQPEGMQECQKALTFKYGIRAIPVELVALFEGGENAGALGLPPQSILGGLHMLAGMANDLYLNGLPASHPVTPVAIFYRLNSTEDLPVQPGE